MDCFDKSIHLEHTVPDEYLSRNKYWKILQYIGPILPIYGAGKSPILYRNMGPYIPSLWNIDTILRTLGPHDTPSQLRL